MRKFLNRLGSKVLSGALAIVLAAGLCTSHGVLEVFGATSISGVSSIANLPSDFVKGVDVSAVTALEKSGAKYYYMDGTSGDIFNILKDAGVNYVRIRIWNNPYDASSPYKGYGGGNCDLYNAKVLGKRATDAGMKVFIDFQYSDFWADPEKQFAPKAWATYNLAYKKDAVYNFTYNSLKELIDYGVNVGMVQIGNETNGSMAGVGGLYDGVWDLSSGVAALMQQGCSAVDKIETAYGKTILKVLHFTDLLTNGEWYAKCLSTLGVDYDVFATSYYPMWHGTTANMATTLTKIATTYNKKVMVAETAYPYTYSNYDSTSNNIGDSSGMNYSNYAVSVSGQASALRDVFAAVAQVNNTKAGYGLGAFYWEPEWISVSSSTWGTYGSGWTSSTSGNYEKLYSSAVNFYSTTDRGSSWDNMTLFNSSGVAMKSLYVFKDINGNYMKLSANNLTAGTYTSNLTSGNFTIGASSTKNVQVSSASTTVNGTTYSKLLLMNGAADSTGRYIKFTTTGSASVQITAASTTSTATRTIRVAKASVGGTTQADITVSGTPSQQTVTVATAGTYYIYSTNSGINVYDVTVGY